MAFLFARDNAGVWCPNALDAGQQYGLTNAGELTSTDQPLPVSLISAGSLWSLALQPGTRVALNGREVITGFCVLTDRDHWTIHSPDCDCPREFFFSAEGLATIAPFPAHTEGSPSCPRCKSPFEPGQLAVKCPSCGTWHHQAENRPCWSYDKTCALCPQTTATDAELNWTPEDL